MGLPLNLHLLSSQTTWSNIQNHTRRWLGLPKRLGFSQVFRHCFRHPVFMRSQFQGSQKSKQLLKTTDTKNEDTPRRPSLRRAKNSKPCVLMNPHYTRAFHILPGFFHQQCSMGQKSLRSYPTKPRVPDGTQRGFLYGRLFVDKNKHPFLLPMLTVGVPCGLTQVSLMVCVI